MIYHKTISSTILTGCSLTILTGKYGIINESSNIKITNSVISGKLSAISFNFNNSTLTLDNNETYGIILRENILSLNSQVNNNSPLSTNIIQKGSIYNYPNPIIPTLSSNLLSNNNDQIFHELDIPSTLDINNKKLFILKYYDQYEDCQDQYGDGIGFIKNDNINLNFSANYLTNNRFAYWSSIYTGRFTKDSNIFLNTLKEFHNLFKSIPRNLNGYTLTINSNLSSWVSNLKIHDFYNGYIIFNTLSTKFDALSIENNDCEITFNTWLMPINNNLNDNKNIIFKCNQWKLEQYDSGKLRSFMLKGDNNIILLSSNTEIDQIFNLYPQNYNSYGNYIEIKKGNISDYENYINNIDQIQNGNIIYDNTSELSLNDKNSLSNHSHKDFPTGLLFYDDFRINDVRPKIYQDNSCIGSIIGWLSGNPIPFGYYICNGTTVPVNNFDPNDIYYNALLAYLMKATTEIQLPNISPQENINGQILIYIIKYNNNFEHY